VLLWTLSGTIILNVVMLVWCCVNVKLYLIDQKRYKNWHNLMFYLTALVLILSSLTMQIFGALYVSGSFQSSNFLRSPAFILACYTAVIYARATMGYF